MSDFFWGVFTALFATSSTKNQRKKTRKIPKAKPTNAELQRELYRHWEGIFEKEIDKPIGNLDAWSFLKNIYKQYNVPFWNPLVDDIEKRQIYEKALFEMRLIKEYDKPSTYKDYILKEDRSELKEKYVTLINLCVHRELAKNDYAPCDMLHDSPIQELEKQVKRREEYNKEYPDFKDL